MHPNRSGLVRSLLRNRVGAGWRSRGVWSALAAWLVVASQNLWLSSALALPPTALRLDGDGDYATVANSAGLNPGTSDFTVVAQFKIDTTSPGVPDGHTIVAKSLGGPDGGMYAGYRVSYHSGQVRFQVSNGVTWSDVWSAGGISSGQWHHVAAMRAGTELRVYVDGQLSGTRTNAVTPTFSITNADPFAIGGAVHSTTSRYLRGDIDSVGFFNRALNEFELYRNRTEGWSPTGANLLASYSFDQTLTADSSGKDRPLTLVGNAKAAPGMSYDNLLPQGDFEHGLTDWWGQKRVESPEGMAQAPELLALETSDVASGSRALRLTVQRQAGFLYHSHNTGAATCNSNHFPAGTTLRFEFSAKSLSGPRWLQISKLWGGGEAAVAITTSWQRYEAYVWLLQSTPCFLFNIINQPTDNIDPNMPNSSVLLDDIRMTVVEKGHANLVTHLGYFEAGHSWPWRGQKMDEGAGVPAPEFLSLSGDVPGPGNTLSLQLSIAKQSGFEYPVFVAGAVAPLALGNLTTGLTPAEMPAGSVLRVKFTAKWVSGASWLAISRAWGGAQTNVRLSPTWQEYAADLPLEQTTSELVFSLLDADRYGLQPAADGVVRIDNVDVRLVGPPQQGLVYHYRADRCATPAQTTGNPAVCNDVRAYNNKRMYLESGPAPTISSDSTGGWPALVSAGATSLRTTGLLQAIGSYTMAYVLRKNTPGTSDLMWHEPSAGNGVKMRVRPDMQYFQMSWNGGQDVVSLHSAPFMAPQLATHSDVGELVVVRGGPAGAELWVNGVRAATTTEALPPVALDGRLLSTAANDTVEISETLAYDHSLTDAELSALHRSLRHRYDIERLRPVSLFSAEAIHEVRTTGSSPSTGYSFGAPSNIIFDAASGAIIPTVMVGGGLESAPLTTLPNGTHALPFDGTGNQYIYFGRGVGYTRFEQEHAGQFDPADSFNEYSLTFVGTLSPGSHPQDLISTFRDQQGWVADGDEYDDWFNLHVEGSTGKLRYGRYGVASSYRGTAGCAVLADEPVVVTVRGSASKGGHALFVNGVKVYQDTNAVARLGTVLFFGDRFRGALAEAALHLDALSDREIREYQEELKVKFSIQPLPASCSTCVGEDCPVCGDGVVSGNEWCDPGADPGCKADCSGRITNAATELSCVDAVDNDGDGLVDCADAADCNSHAACRAPAGGACTLDFDCMMNLVCALGECRAPQCNNALKDPNEQGTDCGGPCPACNGRQCQSACRPGAASTPQPVASLPFATGNFARSSIATFEGPNGTLENARANELRWVDVEGHRLALFEGAATNVLQWSEALDHADAWAAAASSPMTVQPNAAAAPTGTLSAELLSSPNGPARSPLQTSALPAARSALSFWLGMPNDPTGATAGYRTARVFATPVGGAIASTAWDLYMDWTRADIPVSGSVGTATGVSFSDIAGFPNQAYGQHDSASFYAWGAQLEGQPFPTSYVATSNGSATRAADVLTFTSVPSWVLTGQWQIDVAPLYASDEMRPDWRYTLVSFGSTSDIALVASVAGAAKLVVRHAGSTYSSPDITFLRGAALSFTVDAAGDKVVVGGDVTAGEGTYSVPGLAFASTSLRIGGALNGQSEAFAAISEIRQVQSAVSTCSMDSACSCGNGVVDNGEACDPALEANCAYDCSSRAPIICQTNEQCPSGSVCGEGNGPAFDLAGTTNVCWPALCTTQAASHCGAAGACGDCICVPDCSQALCGVNSADGCGGICRGACAGEQPGCATDDECGPGYVCAIGEAAAFGHSPGANVCWPAACDDPIARSKNCGTAGALCGSVCPDRPVDCATRECGSGCGECPVGEVCSVDGTCVVEGRFTQFPPPLQAMKDVLRDPPADPAGTLQGDFSVDANGAAIYTIPIDVPPGRAGHTPKLALQYNSTSGAGLVGKGWSLTGLSAITRCPRTFAQHGYAKGVDLSSDDALCLDGKLLVAQRTNATTGLVEEYRTELDSFVRVVPDGDPWIREGNNPKWYTGPSGFEVTTNEGLILRYGAVDSAKDAVVKAWFDADNVNSDHPVNASWLLKTVTDPSGNVIKVKYELVTRNRRNYYRSTGESGRGFRFTYTGEVRPTTISYGARSSHQVEFQYDDSTSSNWLVRSYRGGVARHFSNPIALITTYVDNVPVRSYRLRSQVGRDEWLLKSVQACAAHKPTATCLPPTVFTYAPGSSNLSLLTTTTDDAGHIPTNPKYANRALERWEPENANNFRALVLDVNGDGREDLAHTRFEGRGQHGSRVLETDPLLNYHIRPSQPLSDGHAFQSRGPVEGNNSAVMGVADFNADGVSDYTIVDPPLPLLNTWYAHIRSTAPPHPTFNDLTAVLQGETTSDPFKLVRDTVEVVDANGDSFPDIYRCKDDEDGVRSLFLYANPRQYANPSVWPVSVPLEGIGNGESPLFGMVSCHARVVMDFDGDGVPNLILPEYHPKGRYLGTPHMFAVSLVYRDGAPALVVEDIGPSPFAHAGALDNYRVIDANGDGLPDLVVLSKEKIPELYLSTGRGFVYASRAPQDGRYKMFERSFVMDVDSDGRQELLIPSREDGWLIHAPYNIRGDKESPWTTRPAYMPFQWAHYYHRHDSYDAYGYQAPHVLDWDGDGVQEVVIRRPPPGKPKDYNHPVFELWKAGDRTQSLLETITDGLGKKITVTYDNGAETHTATECDYPRKCLKVLPAPVVASHTTTGAAGNFDDANGLSQRLVTQVSEYEYKGASTHMRGRGWLGFEQRVVKDFGEAGRLARTTTYAYDLESETEGIDMILFAGHPIVTAVDKETGLANGLVTRTATVNLWSLQWPAAGRPFVILNDAQVLDIEEASNPERTTGRLGSRLDHFEYDDFGNRTLSRSKWEDGRTLSVTTTYVDDQDYLDRGLTGLVKSEVVVGTANGAGTESKSYELERIYDLDGRTRGLPSLINRWSLQGGERARIEQATSLTHDDFGNELERVRSGVDAVTQTYTTVYADPRGLVPSAIKNSLHEALGLPATDLGIDVRTGEMQWVARPDGSWTVVNRDGFGRPVETFDSIGTSSTTRYFMSGSLGGVFTTRTTGSGKPTEEVEYNALGMAIAKRLTEWAPQLGAAQTRVEELGYDGLGRLVAEGVPHLQGSPSPGAHYRYYDGADRVVREERPWVNEDGDTELVTTEHYYASKLIAAPDAPVSVDWTTIPEAIRAHTSVMIAPNGGPTTSVTDARGNVVASMDGLGTVTRHTFGALDYLRSTDVLGDVTTFGTDDLGNVTRLSDPDVGVQDFVYDGLGLLQTHTRNSVTTSHDYDALGRKTQTRSPDGTYKFTYDGDGVDLTSVGHLSSQTVTSTTIGNSSVAYEYKNPGASVSKIRRVVESKTFETTIDPDELGRMGAIHYPALDGRSLSVRYHYEPNFGRLDRVEDAADSAILWKLESIDAFGNATKVSYANGLTSSRAYEQATGRTSSIDVTRSASSNFFHSGLAYDQRGLLSTRTTKIDDGAATTEVFIHDELMRLKHRTQGTQAQETFEYDLKGNLTRTPDLGRLYYERPQPHQVSRTDDGRSFAYLDGNQVSRYGSAVKHGEQHISYTAFDLPVSVDSGVVLVDPADPASAKPIEKVAFRYDAGNRRIGKVTMPGTCTASDCWTSRVLYAGDLYRQTETRGGPTEYHARVPTPDGLVIEASLEPEGVHKFSFLQTDYLGSVVSVADEDGTRIGTTAAYSPFGAVTNPQDSWSGFTSHESDTDLGLINMRGRMYDPAIGRFLTADPLVKNVQNSQNWNRYSYVSNSPLNAIDPSGFGENWGIGMSEPGAAESVGGSAMSGGSTTFGTSPIASPGARVGGDPISSLGGVAPNGGQSFTQADIVSPVYSSSSAAPLAYSVEQGIIPVKESIGAQMQGAPELAPRIDYAPDEWSPNMKAAGRVASTEAPFNARIEPMGRPYDAGVAAPNASSKGYSFDLSGTWSMGVGVTGGASIDPYSRVVMVNVGFGWGLGSSFTLGYTTAIGNALSGPYVMGAVAAGYGKVGMQLSTWLSGGADADGPGLGASRTVGGELGWAASFTAGMAVPVFDPAWFSGMWTPPGRSFR